MVTLAVELTYVHASRQRRGFSSPVPGVESLRSALIWLLGGCLDLTVRLGTNETIPHDVFDTMPMFTAKIAAQSQVLGIAVFAYAYVVTIPSWVNEKKPGVNINATVWLPATVRQLRHHFRPFLTPFPALHDPTRAV